MEITKKKKPQVSLKVIISQWKRIFCYTQKGLRAWEEGKCVTASCATQVGSQFRNDLEVYSKNKEGKDKVGTDLNSRSCIATIWSG